METYSKNIYFITAPDSRDLQSPTELYVALCDFIKTRKQAGCIKVEFHGGGITCVEVMSRRMYKPGREQA